MVAVLIGFMVCFSLAGYFIRVKFTKGVGIQNWSSVPGFDGLCVAVVENCFLIEYGSVPEHFLPAMSSKVILIP